MNLQIKSHLSKPVGQVLKQAGLISRNQIELALKEQSLNQHILIGEILSTRGWIKKETVEFFVNCLPDRVISWCFNILLLTLAIYTFWKAFNLQ